MSSFQKAERKKAKLRLAVSGPSGSGKTLAALNIAKGIGGKIAVIDTENDSASLYADRFDFDSMNMRPPYSPERFVSAIGEAVAAGYNVVIIDSSTHVWNGTGGVLDLLETVAKAKFRGNTWSAWSDLTPRYRKFIDAMLQANAHIIATTRSKTETAQQDSGNGKKQVVKLGMKSEQKDGFEYEFTVALDLIHDGHYATASKDRTGLFEGDAKPVTVETGKMLKQWLESGVEAPEPEQTESVDTNFITEAQAQELRDLAEKHGVNIAEFCKKGDIPMIEQLESNRFSSAKGFIESQAAA